MYKVVNPATGELEPQISHGERRRARRGPRAPAHQAYKSWKATSYPERTSILLKVAGIYEERAAELAKLITK